MKVTPLDDSSFANKTFGRVTTIQFLNRNRNSKAVWSAKCECGKQFNVILSALLSGNTKSCGCSWTIKPGSLRHGLSQTRCYKIWKDMRKRCLNPNVRHAKHYSGRGITVCPEWADFGVFYLDMGEPPKGFSIDRIDNNKGYSKENCRWADILTQMNNTQTNRKVEAFGRVQTLAQWARETGMAYSCLLARLDRGWAPEKAITESAKINQYV